jgi:type I restriction enzyme S subunit
MNVLLSIKPEFADKILNGSKRYEFRKTCFSEPEKVDTVYLYASSPVQRIVGGFTISDIAAGSPEQLWAQFGHSSGMNDPNRLIRYFEGKDKGYAIEIDQVFELEDDIDPREEVADFVPPVSFYYLDDDSELDVRSVETVAPEDPVPTEIEQYYSD